MAISKAVLSSNIEQIPVRILGKGNVLLLVGGLQALKQLVDLSLVLLTMGQS